MILNAPPSLKYIPKRIVSLVPSQTELLYHLGLEAETIGITKFCVHPSAWFKSKTRIGGTKSLNIKKIIKLEPDLIIANNEENSREQVEELARNFPVWVTDVKDFNDSIKMIDDIGQLSGKESTAMNLKLKIKNEFSALANEVSAFFDKRLRAAYFIWRDPYMTVGRDTFISDMMNRCGFVNIYEGSTRYPMVDIKTLKTLHCELIMLSSEPFPFAEKHVKELETLLPGIKILLVDGEMFSWYGSRLLYSPAYFKKLVQQVFKSNH